MGATVTRKKGSYCNKKKREQATVGATVPDKKRAVVERGNSDKEKGSDCDKKKREQL
jgi:hypothetical protein